MIGVFTNLLLLLFLNIFTLNWLGQVGIVVMIASISYSILKHHLFNIRVIATEIFTFSLWIFILVRTLTASSTQEKIIEGGLLLLTIVVGIFLIKSVIKEVEQREHIEKLAKDLEKANTRLKEIDKQKSEFVSFASHQLRSPLTAIKGYASMVLEGDMGKVNEQVRSAISTIFESSKTLASVVDDYLNISRIELGTMKYNFDLLDLHTLVKSTVEELKPNFEKAGVAWSFNCDETKNYRVNADPDKLKQVIANLIDNSMKYSPKGKVDIAVESDTEKKVARFVVSDNGIGMSTVTLGKIFSKFTRADNANLTNIRGTGLGLYVAKDVIGSHKGKIWAESDGEGKGSRFIFELGLA
jgi:signal transduction histidine kinase